MHQRKQLTQDEFEAIVPFLSSRANKAALSAVMVDGRTQADVAREFNVTRKAISQSVGRAWQIHCERGSRPDGWVPVNVVLPQDLAEFVNDMARKARAKHLTEQDNKK